MLSGFSARARRRKYARDLARRMAELDRLDRAHGLGAMPLSVTHTRSARRARGSGGSALLGLLVAVLLLAAVVAFSPSEEMLSVRRLLGFDDDRLAAAPRVPEGGGSHEFVQTQRGSDEPVAYDPCRPVEVVVNPDGAPVGYDDLVDTGLAHVAAATGLRFTRVGVTEDRDVSSLGPLTRRPVLIAWATPDEVPELAGDVAGVAGSVATGDPGRLRYVTGQVMLDRDFFASVDDGEAASAQAVVDHELGHVVGLGHVDDPGELMYHGASERTTYGPGDREGLARLGSVDC